MEYTSAREIRRIIEAGAMQKAMVAEQVGGAIRAPDSDVVERWIQQRIAAAKDAGKLMTDRQFADYKTNRTFDVGDYAKYVGPEREEPVGDRKIKRSPGQRGRIVDVTKPKGEAVIVTFRPLPEPGQEDGELVELVVRQGTPGYLDLERLDPSEVSSGA